MRSVVCYHIKPSILVAKINTISCCFKAATWTSFLMFWVVVVCLFYFFKNVRFGDPLQNLVDAKTPRKIVKWRQNVEKKVHISEPFFHETIVIIMPLEPSGFEKVICSMEMFCFVSVCYLFTTFLSLFLLFLLFVIPL